MRNNYSHWQIIKNIKIENINAELRRTNRVFVFNQLQKPTYLFSLFRFKPGGRADFLDEFFLCYRYFGELSHYSVKAIACITWFLIYILLLRNVNKHLPTRRRIWCLRLLNRFKIENSAIFKTKKGHFELCWWIY